MIELAISLADGIETALSPHTDVLAVAGIALLFVLLRRGTNRARSRTLD